MKNHALQLVREALKTLAAVHVELKPVFIYFTGLLQLHPDEPVATGRHLSRKHLEDFTHQLAAAVEE